MGLFYQHTINDNTELGVWKIEENEAFFLKKVPLQREISHPHKRLQHLAGRFLLQHLFADFPYELIRIADTRKPFLSNEAYHFSVSHCGNFAAAIVSRMYRVGVDVEQVKPIIQRIRHKFLAEDEMMLLADTQKAFQQAAPFSTLLPPDPSSVSVQITNPSSEFLTIAWSAKEAIYKWYGFGGVDFKKHIQLQRPLTLSQHNRIEGHYSFSLKQPIGMDLVSEVIEDLVLTYVIT